MYLPIAVEGLCAPGSGQQGALSVGPHGSIGGLRLWEGLLGLQLETGTDGQNVVVKIGRVSRADADLKILYGLLMLSITAVAVSIWIITNDNWCS